ncbi:MAG TPA: hypothetical protein VJ746_15015 [Nitrospira sp.]|nr:hypothetical protein [Nitrospira sp.]
MFKRTVLPMLVIMLLTIALFDSAAYFLLPPSYTIFAEEYRDVELLSEPVSNPPSHPAQPFQPTLTKGYPRNYFEPDGALGFDIRPGATAMARFREGEYPIFANDVGCFDKNNLRDLQQADRYVYFAGDSFTWGYARYEKKFATLWEQLTKTMAAKCGVTHTGQLHQFEKFKRITAKIGKFPTVVVVGFSGNDPANDLAHPHTTVISGYQVDTAYLKDGAIVRPRIDDVRNTVNSSLEGYEYQYKKDNSPWFRLKTAVKVYSLSANIMNGVMQYLKPGARQKPASQPTPTSNFGETIYNAFTYQDTKKLYGVDPRANASKAAIKNWSEHAKANGYQLVFLLFAPWTAFNDVEYFHHVRDWLDTCGITYIDFTHIFKKAGYDVYDVYWRKDGHFNEQGNRVVAEELAKVVM